MFTSQEPTMQPDRGQTARHDSGPLVDPVFIAARVWRARFWIALLAILGAVVGSAVALSIPRAYYASTDLILDPRGINLVQNEVTQTPLGLASDAAIALIQSQIAVITSSSVLDQVIDEAGLTQDGEFNGTEEGPFARFLPSFTFLSFEDPETAVENRRLVTLNNLRRHVTAQRSANSFVITVTVRSRDAAKAAELANTIADTFVTEQVRAQADTARVATASLSDRLVELRQRVGEAEEAVERYRLDNQLLGVGGRLIDDEFILRINEQLAEVRGQITTLNVRAESMRQASVDDVVQGAFPEELSSPSLVRLRQTFAEADQQNAVLASRLGPRHPQRIASEQSVASARAAIATELQRIVSAAQTELARARDTERDLTTQIDRLRGQQFETSESFVGLRELQREVDASRAIYEAYLLRSRELSQQESLNTLNVRTISEATPPLRPGGVSRKLIAAGGGVVGLGLGVGLAILFALSAYFRSRPSAATPTPVIPGGPSSGRGGAGFAAAPPPEPARAPEPATREAPPAEPARDPEPETEPEGEPEPAREPEPDRGRLRRRAVSILEADALERDARTGGPAAPSSPVTAALPPFAETRVEATGFERPQAGTSPAPAFPAGPVEAATPSLALAEHPAPAQDRGPADARPETQASRTPLSILAPPSGDDDPGAERRERLRQRIREIGARRQLGTPPMNDAEVSEAIRRLSRSDRPSIAALRARRDADRPKG